MKGFSLVEIMVSLAISGIILAGLLRFSALIIHGYAEDRNRIAVHGHLKMTQQELLRLKRGLEPELWDRFPMKEDLIHVTDHSHGGAQFTSPCAEDTSSDCMILWDIRPLREEPVIYEVEDAVSFPESVLLTPVDTTYPPGPAKSIGAMSVLLFYADHHAFCALVRLTAGRGVYLIAAGDQPWLLPPRLIAEDFEVVHLGYLKVTHCALTPDPGFSRKMTYQPWSVDQEGWQPSRRKSSYGHLHSLNWLPCGPNRPDRLVVIGQSEKAPRLSVPETIAGKTFDKEVHCVSIEL